MPGGDGCVSLGGVSVRAVRDVAAGTSRWLGVGGRCVSDGAGFSLGVGRWRECWRMGGVAACRGGKGVQEVCVGVGLLFVRWVTCVSFSGRKRLGGG